MPPPPPPVSEGEKPAVAKEETEEEAAEREEQLLNNDYLAGCLHELLTHVGRDGTGQFDDTRPFYLMGYGNGASVAGFFAGFWGDAAQWFRKACLKRRSTGVFPRAFL
mgnify:CR=1 FL=1